MKLAFTCALILIAVLAGVSQGPAQLGVPWPRTPQGIESVSDEPPERRAQRDCSRDRPCRWPGAQHRSYDPDVRPTRRLQAQPLPLRRAAAVSPDRRREAPSAQTVPAGLEAANTVEPRPKPTIYSLAQQAVQQNRFDAGIAQNRAKQLAVPVEASSL